MRPARALGARSEARPRERGTIIVLASMLMTGLLIMAALSVDVGFWYNTANRAQRAADLAALGSIDELQRVEQATGDRAAAEAAARSLAEQLLAENGFDPDDPDMVTSVGFSVDENGADVAAVDVTQQNLDLFFAGLVLDRVDIRRDAAASVNDCGADCGTIIPVSSGLSAMVNAGTGGDGWRPTLVGDLVFNLFHHSSGDVLSCVDKRTEAVCRKGNQTGIYPATPYPRMQTNYTPKLDAVGTQVFFVVQQDTTVGIGCWDSRTHGTCAGYETPIQLEAYLPNGGNRGNVRIDGPEAIGSKLYFFGDNSRMYCWDTSTHAGCPGYPANTAMTGVAELRMSKPAEGYRAGMVIDEIQFDMEPTQDGSRLYLSLTPVPGPTTRTAVSCWDVATARPCTGFGISTTSAGRPYLFLTYDRDQRVDGVCARAGQGGGSGTGHQCFRLNGSPKPSPLSFDFASGDVPGQQSATGTTSFGHLRTFFPIRKLNAARCWDWTTGAACDISPSNWSGRKTEEYAYIYDGVRCMYGLGHAGLLWTFDVDTGQWPCPGDGSAEATIAPCACADGRNLRWTSLIPTSQTDLSHFDSFTVTVKHADGTVYTAVDLVAAAVPSVDLRPLNRLDPFPTTMTVSIEAEVKDGYDSIAIANDGSTGLRLLPGQIPVLVD